MSASPHKTVSLITVFLHDDAGQDLIEYALIAGIIALGAIAATRNLGTIVSNLLASLSTSFQSAT